MYLVACLLKTFFLFGCNNEIRNERDIFGGMYCQSYEKEFKTHFKDVLMILHNDYNHVLKLSFIVVEPKKSVVICSDFVSLLFFLPLEIFCIFSDKINL